MIESITAANGWLNGYVWGWPMIVLLGRCEAAPCMCSARAWACRGVASSLQASFGVSPSITGLVLAILTATVILGGIKRIGQFTEYLVPFMAIFYLGGGLFIMVRFAAEIPAALSLVFSSAFSGAAATGGCAGSTIMLAMRYGIARGLFSNEAGLGSAPMVHAAAKTDQLSPFKFQLT